MPWAKFSHHIMEGFSSQPKHVSHAKVGVLQPYVMYVVAFKVFNDVVLAEHFYCI